MVCVYTGDCGGVGGGECVFMGVVGWGGLGSGYVIWYVSVWG